MLRLIRNKILLVNFLLSYFIIFVLPLVILTGILYKVSVIDLQKEIINSNMLKLNQLINNLDMRINELELMALKISGDTRLAPYLMETSGYDQIEGIRQVGIYKANNAFIDQLLIYYKDSKNVFANDGLWSKNALTKYLYGFNGKEASDFSDELDNVAKPYIKTPERLDTEYFKGKDVYTYFYPITFQKGKVSAVVIFIIDKGKFDTLMYDMLGDSSGCVFITDKENNLLTSTVTEDFRYSRECLNAINGKGQGVYNIKPSGTRLTLIKTTSGYTGWNFSIAIENVQFYQKANYMRTLILQIVLSLLAFGIFITTLMAARNYKPINNLVRKLNLQWLPNEKIKGLNELERIGKTVITALDQNKNLKAQIDFQLPLVENQILTRLLKGEFNDQTTIVKALDSLQIGLSGPYYTVMAIEIESGSENEIKTNCINEVITLIRQNYRVEGTAFPVELVRDERIVLIVNLSESNADEPNKYKEFAYKTKYLIENQLSIRCVIGIGKVCSNIMEINHSFVESFAALEERITKAGNGIFCFDDILRNQSMKNWYPVEDQLRYVQSLKQGNEVFALKALDNMIGCIKEMEASSSVIKCVSYDIVNMVVKIIYELDISGLDQQIDEIIGYRSLDVLERRLTALTIEICRIVESKKTGRNSQLNEKILEYVNLNFCDLNLNLDSVADRFSLSPGYVSRFFKENIGINFIDYITQLRMNRFKYLLVNTDRTLKDISLSVGYTDLPSFMRKFKNSEGITPGEFRKIHQHGDLTIDNPIKKEA